MFDWIMNVSPWVLGIFALIMIMVGWNFIKSGQSAQTKSIAKVLGVLLVVALMFNLGWLAMDAADDPVTISTAATWAATPTSSTANTTVAGSAVTTTYALTGGAFTGAATGSVTVSYACSRTDTSVADAVARAFLVSVPTVTNTTSGVSHDLFSKDAQGVYDVDFTVSGVATPMESTFPSDPSDRTATVALTYVITVGAIDALADYGTVSFQVNVGGKIITHTIMKLPSL